MEKTPKARVSILYNAIKWRWLLLAIFVYSVALTAGNFLIIRPQLHQYEELKKTRASLDEIYLKIRATDVQTVLGLLQSEAARVSELEAIFGRRCIEKKDFSMVLGDLNRQAQEAGLQVQFIDFLEDRAMEKVQFVKKPITIRFTGTYAQILAFLNGLERIPYWLLVDSFSIISPKNQTTGLNINLVLFTVMAKA
ncbi:MAG: type 4a pilus biogenesis protein PilO [Candidatus Neomarinimicrobiota bacterium]